MPTLHQLLTSLTALVMTLSAQVGNLGQSINPNTQLAQVVQTTSYVQSASNVEYFNSDANVGVTFSSPTTSGNLIAVFVSFSDTNATINSITDSCGNNYILVGALVDNGGFSAQGAYAKNITGGSACTVTATFSGVNSNKTIAVHEISGVDTNSPFDGSATTATTGGAGSNTLSSGNFTTSTNGDYIFGAMMSPSQNGGTITAGTNYTRRIYNTSSSVNLVTEDRIQTTASASTVVGFSPSSFGDAIIVAMAFRPGTSQVPASPSIASFAASPSSIESGQSSTLSWSVSGNPAPTLTLNGNLVSGSSITVSPIQTTTYTLVATNSQGSATSNTTVTVAPATPPVINSFTASPSSVLQGQSSTLSWSVTGTPTPTLSISGIGAVTGTSRSVSPSITTTYTLTTTNSAGSANADATVTITTDTQVPSIPAGLSATAVSSSGINLSWTASTDNVAVVGYKVFRNGIQIATPTTNSYSDTGLSPSTSYSYTVVASDAAGNTSAQSPSASAVTQAQGSILPSDRIIDWSQAGVPGGIDSTNTGRTVCQTFSSSATTAQIQSAVNTCPSNSIIQLNAGTYNLDTINITRDNITIRGAGADKTVIKRAINATGNTFFNVGNSGIDGGNYTTYMSVANWTGGFARGATQITLSSNPPQSLVGNLLYLDQQADGTIVTNSGYGGSLGAVASNGGNTPLQQTVLVTGVSGNTVTFTPGLYSTYWSTSRSPRAKWMNAGNTKKVGIEDLRIEGNYYGVRMTGTYASWVRNVDVYNANGYGIHSWYSKNNEFRNNYVHDTPNSGSNVYGFEMYHSSSDFLVLNNIVRGWSIAFSILGQSGSVFAYNFATVFPYPTQNWMQEMAMTHGAHPHYILFEGNSFPNIWNDNVWGSSSHNINFRNNLTGFYPGKDSNLYPIAIEEANTSISIIGNILGTTAGQVQALYCFGHWCGLSASNFPSLIRHGNVDATTANQTISWDGAISNRNIPASMFLSSQPVWWGTPWGTPSWPAYGPNPNTPTSVLNSKNPAQRCYENLISGAAGTAVIYNASYCYGSVTPPPPPPPTTYTISSSAGSGGTITPSGTITLNSGSSQTFTFTPNTGYRVSNVIVNGNSYGSVSSYTFNNITSNQSISVSFSLVTPIVGDFNSDGLVNSIDLSLMISSWNTSNATYDLNHDGLVNSLDYTIMVQNWSL